MESLPEKSCCTPVRASPAPGRAQAQAQVRPAALPTGVPVQDCMEIPGGEALIGTASPLIHADGEGPLRRKKLGRFYCERGTVTNAAFARFVEETGYVTEAEQMGWSFVFHHLLPDSQGATRGVQGLEWWRCVDGASWRLPTGPQGASCEPDHPAVHVSWTDATAYARWAGGRLPTEAEWEHAARSGLGDVPFPWGERFPDDAEFLPCNIWQGAFPTHDTGADGYMGTAPALSFAPNGYGLHNMVGNVWEWTAEPFRLRSLRKTARTTNARSAGMKLIKGGSFLCHASYCLRYRIAARTGNTPDSATSHMGFRVVYDALPTQTGCDGKFRKNEQSRGGEDVRAAVEPDFSADGACASPEDPGLAGGRARTRCR